VSLDPVGAVSVHVASVPQGQGHRTVLSQVIADVFGLAPQDIRVNTELDTAKDAWSIASEIMLAASRRPSRELPGSRRNGLRRSWRVSPQAS
jgi:CO/xanthine dehydrogenase Mo-binding subunit